MAREKKTRFNDEFEVPRLIYMIKMGKLEGDFENDISLIHALDEEIRRKRRRLTDRYYRHRHKKSVFNKLGNKCVKCGLENKLILQIDHIKGGGSWRKTSSSHFYMMLDKLDIKKLKAEYQLLCPNCNWLKRMDKNENTSLDEITIRKRRETLINLIEERNELVRGLIEARNEIISRAYKNAQSPLGSSNIAIKKVAEEMGLDLSTIYRLLNSS